MSTRRSLRLPITLGVVMIVLLVTLTVLWVLLAVFGALSGPGWAPLFWTFLPLGTAFLLFVLVGVVMYLTLSVKAINLTRRQSNFVDSVTHELKSPITSLKLYLQTLSRRRVSDREQQDFCRFMLADVERLDQLIDHLLDAARLERTELRREAEDVDVAKLIVHCATMSCIRYRVAEDTVELDLKPCVLRAAPGDLEMIFRNLIDNAVKYAGAPPRVKVSLETTPSGHARVLVIDNGRGIPPALRRKIFGRFVRLGTELQRDTSGTGLGLYIVRTLVSRLKGQIKVRDGESEIGTVFEVQLPGVIPAPKTAAGEQAAEASEKVEVA